jgi:hypothetical protein
MVLSTIFLIITTTLAICWSLPFILATFIGFQFYKLTDQKLIKLLKKLPKRSSISSNDEPEGWIAGWPYIGFIHRTTASHGEEKKELYFFTTKKFFETKIKEIESNDTDTGSDLSKDDQKKIKLWERQGNYFHIHYSKRMFDVNIFEPRCNQLEPVNQIQAFYQKNKYCVVLLHGDRGTGKSMIPLLLAKTLTNPKCEVNFCDTFKPTDPGDNFTSLYNNINPSKESPLIVVLEEFDITINMLHYNKVVPHKYIPTHVVDKPSWNQFLDRFDRKYYPWVILVLTSNVSPAMIESLDSSYIRDGRVNLTFGISN